MEDFKIGDTVMTYKEGDHYEVHKETGFKFKVGEISFFNDDKLLVIENEFGAVRASRCRIIRPVEFDQNPHTCHQDKTILDKAKEIIDNREQGYGTVNKNFDTIAAFWTAYLNGRSTIVGGDIGMLMALMKIARQSNGYKEDNLIDVCGYARCTEKYNNNL